MPNAMDCLTEVRPHMRAVEFLRRLLPVCLSAFCFASVAHCGKLPSVDSAGLPRGWPVEASSLTGLILILTLCFVKMDFIPGELFYNNVHLK